MRYEGAVYRPPSEARSLIIQATIGCSHNKCAFCNMYKDKHFRIRNEQDVIEDLRIARSYYKNIEKIFLADGDALIIPTPRLITLLEKVYDFFPECKRVTVYASPKSILLKSIEELRVLRDTGLNMVYLGVESGDDEILSYINKGATSKELIEAGKRIKAAGIKLSCTLINGLGGKKRWKNHAINSAKIINEIDPDYLGMLTLMTPEDTPIYQWMLNGEFQLLTPEEVMIEMYEFIKELELTNCVFRSNHASNYAPLAAVLGKEKLKLLKEIQNYINEQENYRSEFLRGL